MFGIVIGIGKTARSCHKLITFAIFAPMTLAFIAKCITTENKNKTKFL